MLKGSIKYGTFLTVLAILIAIYLRQNDELLQKRLKAVLSGLENLESKHAVQLRPRVAIGYGGCTDVFTEARNLLQFSRKVGKPQHFDDIKSKEELLKSFAYYFRHGAAAERYMSNSTLFDELVEKAKQFPDSYSALGGNAPVMGMRFAKEGCDVLLAAKMTPSLRQMIPSTIKVVGGEVKKDDVHLILEYKHGETWGPYLSPRANRYIVHNDENNPTLNSIEEFDKHLLQFKPHLLVVSGLQMMDNYPLPRDRRLVRLRKVKKQMIDQPKPTRVHFEMASFAEEELLKDLVTEVIPFADSLGMNEQELVNLYNTVYYGNISLVANSTPRVATVLDQMRLLFKLLREKSKTIENSRQLTRIHVHTLAYQAIVVTRGSQWRNNAAAAAKASLTAHRHVCASNNVNLEKATLIMDDSFSTSIKAEATRISINEEKPVSCWNEVYKVKNENIPVEVCVAPVLVCTQASQTAGGGDNISSAGLVLQI